MTILIFLIILSVLVFVHELGHFLAAKSFGIRVDEFGFGYPPRAKKLFSWRGTDVTLNWLPFGGFVKIFGENYENASEVDSFVSKNRFKQAIVLLAGVIGNFLIAGIFLSIGFMVGMPSPVDLGLPVTNAHTTITQVLPNSPADAAGLEAGDEVLLVTRGSESLTDDLSPANISHLISESETPVQVTVKRGNEILTKSATPALGIVANTPALGVALSEMGVTKLGFFSSLYQGFRAAGVLLVETAAALWHLIAGAFAGHADLSAVTGPVGLVGVVGQAAALGFVYILSLAALISINLSIVNLLPFPALDGGRLLFVIIESIIRRPISPRIANTLNNVGFAILILLMVLITIRDVSHLL